MRPSITSDEVEWVLSRLHKVKPTRTGWVACCPSHDDHSPSLSIAQGDSGRALLHCHAGCDQSAVLDAIGWRGRPRQDSMPARIRSATPPTDPHEGKAVYASLEDAMAAYRRQYRMGETAAWSYPDGHGNIIAATMRFDPPGKRKQFGPVAPANGGWVHGFPASPRPLYGLDLLAARPAEAVVLAEGEKTCDALRSLGLLALCCFGGGSSHNHADLSPLAWREVVMLPDCDESGRKHVAALRGLLAALHTPPQRIATVELDGLEEAEDAVEWIERRHGGDLEEAGTDLRERIGVALDAAPAEPPWPERWLDGVSILARRGLLEIPESLLCGWDRWDSIHPFGGVNRHRLYMIAAGPGCFKSETMARMAWGYAANGLRVAWLAGELHPDELIQRMLAQTVGRTVRTLLYGPAELKQQAIAALRPSMERLHIIPAPISIANVKEAASRCDVVFIDYIQRLRPESPQLARHEQLEELSGLLLEARTRHPVAIIAASAISSSGIRRNASTAAKGSSAIGHDADVVYCCEELPEDEDGIRPAEFEVVYRCTKYRQGPLRSFVAPVAHGCLVNAVALPMEGKGLEYP
ncbi:MAG: hypothetical protein O2855_08215 [Planctomycetota bacterium]|nr:hypothetical protein [Planctomycetota bacterium]